MPWSNDIAVRFENILQTPEYVLRVENLLQNPNVRSQEEVDIMTENLTDILVEGVTLADISHANKISGGPKRKKMGKKKVFHPKWHDLSCEEAHRKVAASARLLKCNPKDQSLGAKLRQDIKDYNKFS